MRAMEHQDDPQRDHSTRLPSHRDRVRTTKTRTPLSMQELPRRCSSTQVADPQIELI